MSEPTGAQAAQHPVPQPANQTVRRNLPVAIAVGVVLYAWIVGTLLWWQWGFIVFLVASVVAGSFEITSALNKVRLNAVFTPVLIGAPVTFVVSHVVALRAGPLPAGAALLAGLALMVIASLIGRLRGPVRGYLADGAASLFTIAYLPLLLGSLILLLAQPQGNLRVICYFILVPCGVLALEIGHEMPNFQARFPTLTWTSIPVAQGDDRIVLITADDLRQWREQQG